MRSCCCCNWRWRFGVITTARLQLHRVCSGRLSVEAFTSPTLADMVREMESRFRAQAWAFTSFLWGGKHKRALLTCLGRDLRGHSGADELAKAIWKKKDPDWAGLEKSYRAFLTRKTAK